MKKTPIYFDSSIKLSELHEAAEAIGCKVTADPDHPGRVLVSRETAPRQTAQVLKFRIPKFLRPWGE